jgi:hypothetical protein
MPPSKMSRIDCMRVELRDEARADLVDGAWFYGRQAPGLDGRFIACLRDDLRTLETTSGIHEKYRGCHRKLSQRFPFAIYYLDLPEFIRIEVAKRK